MMNEEILKEAKDVLENSNITLYYGGLSKAGEHIIVFDNMDYGFEDIQEANTFILGIIEGFQTAKNYMEYKLADK